LKKLEGKGHNALPSFSNKENSRFEKSTLLGFVQLSVDRVVVDRNEMTIWKKLIN